MLQAAVPRGSLLVSQESLCMGLTGGASGVSRGAWVCQGIGGGPKGFHWGILRIC